MMTLLQHVSHPACADGVVSNVNATYEEGNLMLSCHILLLVSYKLQVVPTKDRREALQAFIEKRKPNFQGH